MIQKTIRMIWLKGPDDLAEGPDVSGSIRAARSPDDPDDWPDDPATSTKVL